MANCDCACHSDCVLHCVRLFDNLKDIIIKICAYIIDKFLCRK